MEADAPDEHDTQQLHALAPTLGTPFPKAEDLTGAHPAVKGYHDAQGL